MQFKAPAVTYFYYIADQIGIVDAEDLVQDLRPVQVPGHEPDRHRALQVSSKTCTPQNIQYQANPHFWEPGLPKVATVNYPAYLTNDSANNVLAKRRGAVGQPVHPRHRQVPRGPARDQALVPAGRQRLGVHQPDQPAAQGLAVRQAMAYAIDRAKASAAR